MQRHKKPRSLRDFMNQSSRPNCTMYLQNTLNETEHLFLHGQLEIFEKNQEQIGA